MILGTSVFLVMLSAIVVGAAGCNDGFWGEECQNICNCSESTVHCDPVKGCVCKDGWQGETCEEDINECDTKMNVCGDPRKDCMNIPGSFQCNCQNGFMENNSGQCEACTSWTYGDSCREYCRCIVENSESCDHETGSCKCKTGWSGTKCDVDVDECKNTDTCPNHLSCQNTHGGYECQ